MATTADARERALIYLRTLELMVGDLPDVAAEWGQLSDGERESWSHDWDNEIGGLRCLVDYVAQGVLTDSDLRRFQSVRRKLDELAPLIARLNLQHPPLPERGS